MPATDFRMISRYSIDESRNLRVKRKYANHPEISVGKHAPARAKILNFVSESGGSVSESDLLEFIKMANESEGTKVNPRWIKRNSRYLKETTVSGEKVYKLTTLGKRVIKNTTLNEGNISKWFKDNIDTFTDEEAYMKAGKKAGFTDKQLKDIADDVEQGGDDYMDLKEGINFNDIKKLAKQNDYSVEAESGGSINLYNDNYSAEIIIDKDGTFTAYTENEPWETKLKNSKDVVDAFIDFEQWADGISESALNEGQYSWMAYDTDEQIGCERFNRITVYMFDDKGNKYKESKYEGYGEFGGKDYYDLLAEMNGFSKEDLNKKLSNGQKYKDLRNIGIALAFDKLKTRGKQLLFPIIVQRANFNWKSHDFSTEQDSDPNQGWMADEEDDDIWGNDDSSWSTYESNSTINEKEDFVVTGYEGGYNSTSYSYTYIVTAKNKREAKSIVSFRKDLKRLTATPVSDFKELDPYRVFKRI